MTAGEWIWLRKLKERKEQSAPKDRRVPKDPRGLEVPKDPRAPNNGRER